MSITLDLTPSFKKIDRAERKLTYLHASIDQYIASSPYTLNTEFHDNMFHLTARRVKPVPDELAWEIVEAVGHLRSALDKMLVALVESNGKGVSGVSFPFGSMSEGKPESFPNTRHINQLSKKLSPEQLDLAFAQKAFLGGNDLL